MARTRATKAVPSAKPDTSETSAPKTLYSLPEEAANPPKVFILPTKATKAARIVSLLHPRHAKPSRYLVCPETGIYEFTKIAAPKTTPRSWLIETKPGNLEDGTPDAGGSQLQAQITNGADLFIATAFDPLFLMLPALFGPATTKDDAKRLFLTSDDHFDAISDSSSHLCEVLRCPKTRSHFEARMAVICDSVDAGDEKMFRVSDKKFVDVMIGKAKAMGAALPPSMEERFVKKPLEAPLSLQKSNAAKVETKPAADDVSTPGDSTPRTESAESQASATTLETSASFASEASTAATSVNEEATEDAVLSTAKAPEDVVALQKLRVALDFICASYATPAITSRLQTYLLDPAVSGVNFAPLNAYLEELTQLRIEAASSMSTSNYSRKRHLDEEEEEVRAEKRRKLEDEKKRKANQSRGVKNLQKVNTTGMKKMSDFFKKK
ncbi:hypothetical protein VD0002_g8235 [Verticillium dahliae]|uniref:Ribonuclease H2 subunit B n=2 Tax=Verticillium dahliae TaxID=27337 RepID=G2XIS0_VERDV|nr:uncharacterized protein VDAG_10043 [Verticillium dahliae VdLs.17]KAF3347350.1 60S ribosome subunit biogenesis protein NIP7 [Verticillium dahliae VDG2]KAH6700777.1 ribonuclease H2, subunit B [Verticillium dahliae]EGY20414.1 hypothetical protein VDAG_10043 [Verticillium dahliae VdLs.17]PNH33918.1 hypothetical protein BJF96_g2972 [Verticillium dahliae]PNH48101.1 hypothetical protein VD0003_g8686 [Verticillium dahliae]